MKFLVKNFDPSKNIRLFKSDFLESFSYVHPAMPALIFVPVVAYFLGWGTEAPWLTRLGAAAVGVLIWTFTEYTLHRYMFHFPATSKWGKRIVFLFHGIHHDDPEDARRLVMPPAVSIVLAYGFFHLFRGGFLIALGAEATALLLAPFFAGFILGYLVYDYIHFWVHFGRPRTALGKSLKQYHMLHHFVTPHARYGVSSPLWDVIIGATPFSPRPVPKARKEA
jgi:sterol desaturase/sphingolipid hydroxylase (fatty acid hydroxylase superfamily)